ncbi:MAG TPA: hypothetical protein VKY15_09155 [Acidimicrobiales bacterium]|nr:hypothetical protein [Acidimicrobiales bacterium]
MASRWLSRRALLLHLAVLVVAPGCLVAGWWQANVAMSGNTLSYVYAFEWPAFAAMAIYVWWQLLHEPKQTDSPAGAEGQAARPSPTSPLRRRPELEDDKLRAYNDYLARLAAEGGRKTWRNPTGAPSRQRTSGSQPDRARQGS